MLPNLVYKTKGEESSDVIRMIDILINDIEKENPVMKLEEFSGTMPRTGAQADSKSMADAEGRWQISTSRW